MRSKNQILAESLRYSEASLHDDTLMDRNNYLLLEVLCDIRDELATISRTGASIDFIAVKKL